MQQAEENKYKAEVEGMYTKYGWKWVVLAYTAGKLLSQGKQLPSGFLQQLTLTRTEMESGCSSVCDLEVDLRDLENELFSILLSSSKDEVNMMLELIGKAMNGTLDRKEVNLSPFKVVLADCTIPSVCSSK